MCIRDSTYAAAALIDQVDRALSAVEGEPARVAVEGSLAHTLRRLGCRSDNPLGWKPSWDWERELSDDLMIEAYLKAKWRCGVETVTTAGDGRRARRGRSDQRRGERPRAKREYWARSSSRRDVTAGITKTSRVTSHAT